MWKRLFSRIIHTWYPFRMPVPLLLSHLACGFALDCTDIVLQVLGLLLYRLSIEKREASDVLSMAPSEKIQGEIRRLCCVFPRSRIQVFHRILGSMDPFRYCQGEGVGLWLPADVSDEKTHSLYVHRSNLHRVRS